MRRAILFLNATLKFVLAIDCDTKNTFVDKRTGEVVVGWPGVLGVGDGGGLPLCQTVYDALTWEEPLSRNRLPDNGLL